MHHSDDETLAPVTYLFGEPRSNGATEAGGSSSPSARQQPEGADVDALRDGIAEIVSEPVVPQRREGKFDRISNVSMHALGRRGISSAEMRDYLVKREFDLVEVEAEIERLENVQLLDDTQLAETLVRTLRDRKGLGRSALTSELRRRKLDGESIELAMSEVGDDELALATELALKRAPQLRNLDDETAKRRLSGFLMRKGYSGSVVSAAVAQALRPNASRSSGPVFR